MPKDPKVGGKQKVVHPNSRLAAQMARKKHHDMKQDRRQNLKALKVEVLGEKLKWFHDHLDESKTLYSLQDVQALIEEYFLRFDEELEQISIVNSVKGRTGLQHVSRLDSIKMTLDTEKRDYNTCGLEIPDLTNGKVLKCFRSWTGEMRFVPNIKMRKFTAPEDNAKRLTKDGKDNKTTTGKEPASASEETDTNIMQEACDIEMVTSNNNNKSESKFTSKTPPVGEDDCKTMEIK